MGLRIIDRHKKPLIELTDQDRRSGLEDVTHNWFVTRGKDLAAEADFVAHFQKVRERLKSPHLMLEMASRVKENIKDQIPSSAPHQKVDVATLLELL